MNSEFRNILDQAKPISEENKVLYREWIAALLSGEYKQGTGALKFTRLDHNSTYCCLGVVGDLLVKKDLAAWVQLGQPGGALTLFTKDGDAASMNYLPVSPVLSALQLPVEDTTDTIISIKDNVSHVLISLNDRHHSFKTIANVLEYLIGDREWDDVDQHEQIDLMHIEAVDQSVAINK